MIEKTILISILKLNYFIYINFIFIFIFYFYNYFKTKKIFLKQYIFQILGVFSFVFFSFFIMFDYIKKEEKLILNSDLKEILRIKPHTIEKKINNKLKRILVTEQYYIKNEFEQIPISKLNYYTFKDEIPLKIFCYKDGKYKDCGVEKRGNIKNPWQTEFSWVLYEGRHRIMIPKNKIMISQEKKKKFYYLYSPYSVNKAIENEKNKFLNDNYNFLKNKNYLIEYPFLKENKYGKINFQHVLLNFEDNELKNDYKIKFYDLLKNNKNNNPILFILKYNEDIKLEPLNYFYNIYFEKNMNLNDTILFLIVNNKNNVIYSNFYIRKLHYFDQKNTLLNKNIYNDKNFIINEFDNFLKIYMSNFNEVNKIKIDYYDYFEEKNLKIENYYQFLIIILISLYNYIIIFLFRK